MELSDKSLIAQVLLTDNHRAFCKLVEKYQSGVRSLLLKLTSGNKALADDLSQEVFIRVYKYLKTYKSSASFSTWLYRIAYNVFKDYYKKEKFTDDISDTDYICESNTNSEANIDIENALKELRETEKVVILLHYEKGFSHTEISKILQIPLGTVKSHIIRAKEKLKKYYNYGNH